MRLYSERLGYELYSSRRFQPRYLIIHYKRTNFNTLRRLGLVTGPDMTAGARHLSPDLSLLLYCCRSWNCAKSVN